MAYLRRNRNFENSPELYKSPVKTAISDRVQGLFTYTIKASPKRLSAGSGNEENDSPVLCLQHFKNQTFVDFRKVLVGETKTMTLRVENPCDTDLVLSLSRGLNPKKGFKVNFVCETVPANKSIAMDVMWTPNEEGCQRETLYFETNARHKTSVRLIGSGILPKAKPRKVKCVTTTKRSLKGRPTADTNAKQRRTEESKFEHFETPVLPRSQQSMEFMRRETFLIAGTQGSQSNSKSSFTPLLQTPTLKPKHSSITSSCVAVNTSFHLQCTTANKETQACIHFECRCETAARVIQRSVKSFLFRRRLQKQIEAKKNAAALTIQKIWRGYKTRCIIFELNEKVKEANRCDVAARVLQRSVKSFLFRRRLQKQIETKRNDAALTIQKIWRGYQSRRYVSEIKEAIRRETAACIIQRFVKSFLRRKKFQKQMEMNRNAAALKIQKIWRGYKTRCRVFELNEKIKEGYRCDAAARVIQRSVKSFLFRRWLQKQMEMKRNTAALTIQKIWRGYKSRRYVSEIKEAIRCETAACVVQRSVKSFLFRRRIQKQIETKKNSAALTIQKIWRGYKSRRYVFEIKETIRCEAAAQVIQRSVKSFLLRRRIQTQVETKRNDAALKIQKIWRGYKTRCRVFELNEKIKEAYRCDVAARVLQRSVKSFLFRKRIQKQIETKRNDAALTIQKIWRGYQSRRYVSEIKEAIRCETAACIIQKSVKSFLFRRKFQKQMEMKRNAAALMIQKIWRGHKTRCTVFELNERIKEGYRCDAAARVIQRSVKSFMFRRRIQMQRERKRNDAALIIQKIWRGYKSRSYVFEIKIVMRCDSAARVIQRSVKSFLFRRRLQKQIETKRNDAALTIQKIWRGYKTRCHVFELNEQIKEAYRCDAAACVLQRSVKLFLFRKRLQIQREKKRIDAALTIQKIWRGYKSRHHVLEIKETIKCDNSVRIIQRSVKSFLLRRRVQKKMEMKRNAAALMIQKIWRAYQTRCCVFELKEIIKEGYRCDAAARVLQRSVKSFLFRRRLQMRRETKRNDAALKIQKVYRGYKTRRYQFEINQRIKEAFDKVQESTSRASEQLQLGVRTTASLSKLLTYKLLNPLSSDLENLAKTTSMSNESCLKIANESNSVNILLKIIEETNRSEPHKRIVLYATTVLLNLAKFEETFPMVLYSANVFQVIPKFMKIYYKNKPAELFNKLATLLFILLQNHPLKAEIIADKFLQKIVFSLHTSIRDEYSRSNLEMKKGNMNTLFSPLWSMRRNNVYEFSDRLDAISSIKLHFPDK